MARNRLGSTVDTICAAAFSFVRPAVGSLGLAGNKEPFLLHWFHGPGWVPKFDQPHGETQLPNRLWTG